MEAEDKWLQHAMEHHHILTPGFMSDSCTPTLGPKYGRAESKQAEGHAHRSDSNPLPPEAAPSGEDTDAHIPSRAALLQAAIYNCYKLGA